MDTGIIFLVICIPGLLLIGGLFFLWERRHWSAYDPFHRVPEEEKEEALLHAKQIKQETGVATMPYYGLSKKSLFQMPEGKVIPLEEIREFHCNPRRMLRHCAYDIRLRTTDGREVDLDFPDEQTALQLAWDLWGYAKPDEETDHWMTLER